MTTAQDLSNPASVAGGLLARIRLVVEQARAGAARQVNTLQLVANYEIGRLLVEDEQGGSTRAEYGAAVLASLAEALTAEYGRGFSVSNLKLMRRFYLAYQRRIGQTLSVQLTSTGGRGLGAHRKGQTASALSEAAPESADGGSTQVEPGALLTLSWSHYVFLLGVDDRSARAFYEIEASDQQWSLRELRRQFDAGLYERLALSRDAEGVRALAREGQQIARPADVLKSPLVLEFLGLEAQARYSESDLESAIIDRLERFLLELGKGFLFEARQKRFTFDEEHFFVDLVTYNRLLRCHVLIDLKIGKLTHQDLGQMQMYVNYFNRHVRLPDEHPTVGIVLCRQKNDALVEITLPDDSGVYASEYQLYLPSREELRERLLGWTQEFDVDVDAES